MIDTAQPRSFFQPGGTLPPDSPSYIVREADDALFEWVKSGEYCNLLTARQMGKSSLIVHTQKRLQAEGVHSALIDLTAIGSQQVTADGWYYSLVSDISRKLGLDIDEQNWWEKRQGIGSSQRFTEFLQQVVLKEVPEHIVIFFDEIDSTLNLPFTDNFFITIRALYNDRASNPENKRLTFVLVGVARPADLIKYRTRTPYNIGRSVDLEDFSVQDAKKLLPGLEKAVSQAKSERILKRVLYWTGGQPYLTQRACAEMVASGNGEWPNEQIDKLVNDLFFREGQIRKEANLNWIDEYIQQSKHRGEMLSVYQDILSGKRVRDEERSIEKNYLKLSGLVKATPEGYLVTRNRIYEGVFGRQWFKSQGVEPELPRVGRRWRMGVVVLAAVALIAGGAVLAQNYWGKESTPTPEPSPSPTQVVVVPPTSTPLPPTETHTPTLTPTCTATLTETPTSTPTTTPTPTTPSTVTPSPTATSTSTPAPTPTATGTHAPIPTPTRPVPTPTSTPIRRLLSAPVLVEPESGAVIPPNEVRLKWTWYRRLEGQEKFAIRWEVVTGPPVGDWWVDENGILGGWGAIDPAGNGYKFEANFGIGSYPPGEAYWSVAIFDEASGMQISQWSERRPIFKK